MTRFALQPGMGTPPTIIDRLYRKVCACGRTFITKAPNRKCCDECRRVPVRRGGR